MIYIPENIEHIVRKEQVFEVFKHDKLICCVQRMAHNGNFNGYVAVRDGHPLYGKEYSSKILVDESPEFNGNYIGIMLAALDNEHELNVFSLDVAIKVHGGLTYSSDSLVGIDESLFGKLWWFGFDTSHAWDISPFQDDRYGMHAYTDSEYRTFEYVKNETKILAAQLSKFTK